MLMSVATLVGFVWIMYEFAMKPAAQDVEVVVATTTTSSSKARSSNANRGNRGGRGGNKRRR
jgi:hypothetical protein